MQATLRFIRMQPMEIRWTITLSSRSKTKIFGLISDLGGQMKFSQTSNQPRTAQRTTGQWTTPITPRYVPRSDSLAMRVGSSEVGIVGIVIPAVGYVKRSGYSLHGPQSPIPERHSRKPPKGQGPRNVPWNNGPPR
jgi:hypothetical protein